MNLKLLRLITIFTFLSIFCLGCPDTGNKLYEKKEYWKNGKLKAEKFYKNDKPEGKWTEWHKEGKKYNKFNLIVL